ncbi:MAG: thioesterase family protein [Burkholderiales bacterium]
MNLYLRLCWVILRSLFRARRSVHEATTLELRVWPNDLDVNRHMNNGRFMSIVDLAIVELLMRTGFMSVVRSLGGHIVVGGSLITFRQQLTPFAKYRLQLQYLGCNPHWHVFGFVFLSRNGAIAAKGLLKGGAVRRGQGLLTSPRIWEQFQKLYGETVQVPVLPAYARDWLNLETTVLQSSYGEELATSAGVPVVPVEPYVRGQG